METSPFMLIPASLKLSPSSHCSLLSLGSRLSPRLLPRPRTPFLSSSSIPLGLRNNCKARELANYFPNIVPTVHYAPSKPAGKRRQSTDSWKRVVRYVFKRKVILLCFSESLWLGRGVNFQVKFEIPSSSPFVSKRYIKAWFGFKFTKIHISQFCNLVSMRHHWRIQ